MDYIARGRAEGARLAHRRRARPRRRASRAASSSQPTVFADVTDDMTIAREEIFGPVMSRARLRRPRTRRSPAPTPPPYGLAAGVFTRDLARAHRVIARLDAGTTWINAYNLTPVEAPFGGVKARGLGRENGRAALEHWSRVKSVYVGPGPVEAPF